MLVPELDQNAVGVKTEPVDGTKLVSLLNQVLEANKPESEDGTAGGSSSDVMQAEPPPDIKHEMRLSQHLPQQQQAGVMTSQLQNMTSSPQQNMASPQQSLPSEQVMAISKHDASSSSSQLIDVTSQNGSVASFKDEVINTPAFHNG